MVAQFEHRFANSRSPLIPLNHHSPDDRRSAMNIRVFRPFCNTQRRGGRTNAAAGNERVAPSIDLSFTAHVGTLLVGSVRLSPVRIGQTKALLLGPLTVEPPFRERGVGQALIARACSAGPCHHAGAGRSGTDFGRRTGRWRLRRRFGTDPGGIARRAGLRPELEKRRQFLHLRAEPAQNCQPPRLLLAN